MKSVFTKILAALIAVVILCAALTACSSSKVSDDADPDFKGFNFSFSRGGIDHRGDSDPDDPDDPTDAPDDPTEVPTDPPTDPPTVAPTDAPVDLTKFDGYVCYTDSTRAHKHYLKITSTEMRVYYASFNGGAGKWEERYFVIDLRTADLDSGILTPSKIMDDHNTDKTDTFNELWFMIGQNYAFISMDVDRDENKLAGGAQQNLEDGTYFFFAP